MARPGFGKRLRECLSSNIFETAILSYLDKNARDVTQSCTVKSPSKFDATSGLEIEPSRNVILSGEFSLEAHGIWQRYLQLIEDNMDGFRESEGLTAVEFKQAIEDLPKQQTMLVRLMIASWEFEQFIELCKDHCDYMDEQEMGGGGSGMWDEKGGDDDDDFNFGGSGRKYDSKEDESKKDFK